MSNMSKVLKETQSLLLVVFLLLGGMLVWFYLGDPLQTQAMTSTQGLGILVSSGVNVTHVALALENWVNPPLLSVGVWCGCPKNAFNVTIVLPFVVTSGYTPWPWQLIPSPTVWHVQSGGYVSSIVYNSLLLSPPHTDFFQTSFQVANAYLTSNRGIETMILQLDTGIVWSNAFANFTARLGVNPVPVTSLNVYVVLPASAREIQAFPESSFRKPLPNYLTNGTLIDSIEWDLKNPETITLSYVDGTAAGAYEACLVVGSLILGAGISEALDMVLKRKARTRITTRDTQPKPRDLTS